MRGAADPFGSGAGRLRCFFDLQRDSDSPRIRETLVRLFAGDRLCGVVKLGLRWYHKWLYNLSYPSPYIRHVLSTRITISADLNPLTLQLSKEYRVM